MIINPATLEALYYNFKLEYQGAYEKTPSFAEKVATTVPSSSASNRYPWAKQIPTLREWIGERKVSNLEGRSYEIVNKKFELTVEVKKEDLEDDNLGLYPMQMQQMGMQAKKWADYLISDLIASGTSALAFDGQPFFNASHPVDSSNSGLGTYSNLLTGSALSATTYQTARQTMMSYKGEDGKPLSIMPGLLVVPPQLEAVGRQILNADFIATSFGINAATGSQTNVLKGSADLLVLPELAGEGDAWYLLDVSKPIKPFVFQLRKAPEMVALTAPTDDNCFWRSTFVYGIDSRGNAGFSLPFLALRGKA